MKWAVEIEDMTVAYDMHPVLWDVDMKVPQGALAAVLGPNGAGKSTLLKAALAFLPQFPAGLNFMLTVHWPFSKKIKNKSSMFRKAAVSTGISPQPCWM